MRRLAGGPSATEQAKPDDKRHNRRRIVTTETANSNQEEAPNNKKGLLKSRPFSVRLFLQRLVANKPKKLFTSCWLFAEITQHA